MKVNNTQTPNFAAFDRKAARIFLSQATSKQDELIRRTEVAEAAFNKDFNVVFNDGKWYVAKLDKENNQHIIKSPACNLAYTASDIANDMKKEKQNTQMKDIFTMNQKNFLDTFTYSLPIQ